jgi:hypothetical protein
VDDEAVDLKGLADKLYAIGKELFPRGTVQDAVAWSGRYGTMVAWVMDAKRMPAAGVAHDRQVPFSGRRAAAAFERQGIRAETLKYEREMVMGDFLPRASNEFYDWDDDGVSITMIPAPGYPWPAPEGYYSAKRGKVLSSERPAWLYDENIVDEARNIDSPGLNLCKMFPDPIGAKVGAEAARYGAKPDDYFIVTHAMGTVEGMTRYGTVGGVEGWEENAAKVVECGGLLFSSMAIGPIPATNFGVGVMVADVGIVINSLKPHLKAGASPPAAIYDSDAWTGRTGSFLTDTAVAAFQQMHGHSDYTYYTDLNVWPLGAPRAWAHLGPGSDTEEIRKVTTLKKELRARFKLWKRDLSPSGVELLREKVAATKESYGYLEAKVNGVMAMSEFPFAAIPPQQEEGFRRFLDITGFQGEVLVVDLPDEILEVMLPDWMPEGMSIERRTAIQTWASMQYGWNVAEAVLAAGREIEL